MQRHALAVLFALLALGFAGVAVAALAGGAGSAGRVVVGVAAAAVCLWFASLAATLVRRR